jgi:hypothetical protein
MKAPEMPRIAFRDQLKETRTASAKDSKSRQLCVVMLISRILLVVLTLGFGQRLSFGLSPSNWRVLKAEDSHVSFEQEKVVIQARENSFASLVRPAPTQNLFRVTCEVFPSYSRNHANGILLFWDARNWIRFAVVRLDVSDYGGWFAHKGGGYYLVNRLSDGHYSEEVLGSCCGCQPHRLALELAQDGLRFMIMAKMEQWLSYKLEYRDKITGNRRPERVFVGKTGIDPAQPAKSAAEDFAFCATDMGAEVVSELSQISIIETPVERQRLSDLEKEEMDGPGIDPLGMKEISGPQDPTFASVSQYFPDMKFYREAIGIKDHPQDIGVGFDGSLEFKDRDVSSYWMDSALDTGYFTANSQRLGRDIRVGKRYLLDGDWPAIVCEFSTKELKYKQTVFGYSDNFTLTGDLYGYCALEVSNLTDEKSTVELVYSVAPERLRWKLILGPRGRERVFLKTPFDRVEAKAARLTSRQYQQTLKTVRNYWSDLFKRSVKWQIPERRVADAFKAWLAYSFINVDKRGDRYFICDGTGFYNEIYGYSACIYIRALMRLGYFEDARTYLLNQLQFVREDGLFLLNFGATDTGSYLRAFADYYRYTRDKKTIADAAPQIKKMAGWIIKQRASSKTDNPVTSGLLHVRPYADHPDPTYAYLTDTYLCKGMEEAGYLMTELGDSAAAEVLREAAHYRRDILRSMDHAVVERGGMRLLPMLLEPDGQAKDSKNNNFRGDDYYGSNCSMLMEIGLLDPKGPYADLLVNALERRGGKSLGCLAWRRGIDHAYLYGYLLNCLQRNRPREAVLGLYGWMAYGMSRNTYAGVEVSYHRLGDNTATLPHTFSCSEQMRLLLDMLVRPDGDDLYLAQAVPDAWLMSGKTIAVQDAPTPFGNVSYRIKSTASGLKANVEFAEHRTPKTIYFGLRPAGKRVQSVRVNKKEAEVRDGLLTIANPERQNTVEVIWK